MVFENGVKNIQAAAYNGARTVNGNELKEFLIQSKMQWPKNCTLFKPDLGRPKPWF